MAIYNLDNISGSGSSLDNSVLAYIKSLLAANPYLSMEELVNKAYNEMKSKGYKYRDFLDAINGYANDYYSNLNNSLYDKLRDGSMSGSEAQLIASQTGLGQNPGLSDVINNQIAQDNVTTAYNREIEARDSSLTSTINQLQQAGMNPGSAINIGGSSLGNVGAAQTIPGSSASLSQQRAMNQYNEKQKMTRQLISMVGSIAASGIGGGTYGLARSAAIGAARSTVAAAKTALSSRKIVKDKGHEDDPDSWYIH